MPIEGELAKMPDAQVVICENARISAHVSPVLEGAAVIACDLANDDAESFACLAGRDVICIGDIPMVWVSAAKPSRIRVCTETVPAEFTLAWLRGHLEPYPPTNTELRTVQPYNSESETRKAKLAPLRPPSQGGPSDVSDPDNAHETDLQAILGTSSDEPLPEPPEYVTDGPEPDLTPRYEPPSAHISQIWSRPNADWPMPIDILRIATQQEIDLTLLPGAWQDRHGDISRRTGCDAGISVLTDFTALATLADDSYRANPREHDWTFTQRCGIFGTVVGETGSRKSAASEAALKAAWEIDTEQERNAGAAIKKFILAKKFYDAEVADYVRENKGKDVKGIPPPEPEIPMTGSFRVNDFTIEGLRRLLTHNQNGVLVVTDEMQTMLGGMGRYSSAKGAAAADKGFILQLYDGGEKNFARGGDSGANVKNWKASILALTTPQSICDLLRGKDTEADGFLQRQLLCCPRLAAMGADVSPDEKSMALYLSICREFMRVRHGAPMVLKFEPKAIEYFREFETKIRDLINSAIYAPAMRGSMEKWTGTLARIALIYQLYEFAKRGQEATANDKISLESARMAGDFLLLYQLPQQEYFWERLIGGRANPASTLSTSIAQWIIAHGLGSFKLRDLMQSQSATWLDSPNMQVPAMRFLEDSGWIEPETAKPSRSRQGLFIEYAVNPNIHSMYAGEVADQIRALRKARRDNLEAKREQSRTAKALRSVS